MPPSNDILKQLMPLFQAEAQDYLQALNRLLLELEKHPDEEATRRLHAEMFRVAHTLKGSARSVRLESVGKLAHALETLFGRMQRGQVSITPEIFDKAYHALDTMGSLVAKSAEGDLTPVDVSAECASLESFESAANYTNAPTISETESPSLATSASPELPTAQSSISSSTIAEFPQLPIPAPTTEISVRPENFSEETVRVAITKLDALFASVGELQVARIGSEQHLIEMRAMLDLNETWEAAWLQTRAIYQRLLSHLDSPGNSNTSPEENRLEHADLTALFEFLAANEKYLHSAHANTDQLHRQMVTNSRRMAQVTAELQDDVRRMRMMPVAMVFDTFPRMVRDLARDLGKEVRLVTEGSHTEIDRSMLEQIKAPLLHLIRNSIDHGIESPNQRASAGKPREGTITLSAFQRGGSIVIRVADDGAGIDPAQVKASAIKKGLIGPEAAQTMSEREAMWLIFRSGISTRTLITDVSGRGVGMDVVREAVEQMQGVIDLKSAIGKGTVFSLSLPLTVTATLCLLAQVGGETFAIPLINVEHIVRVGTEEIGFARGRKVIHDEGRPIVVVGLADLLQTTSATAETNEKKSAIILGSAEKRAAFLVDALLGTQEVVVKNLPRPFVRVRYATGATILGTGQAIVVLNVGDLLRAASRENIQSSTIAPVTTSAVERGAILVADDSITTRTLEKNILEAAGYRVQVATDGAEAWTILQNEGVVPQGIYGLLISDVNMPRLDGFELVAKVRSDERLKHLPTILITSLDSRQDRERGIEVGANAYIVKSAFDQDSLLSTIQQLI